MILCNSVRNRIVRTATSLALSLLTASLIAADKPVPTWPQISGEEIFRREWIANDPRSHGGDGLGPVFNESSCVACHNQGGIGGGGPVDKNVSLATAALPTVKHLLGQIEGVLKSFRDQPQQNSSIEPITDVIDARPVPANRAQNLKQSEKQHAAAQKALFELHPGFRNSRTIVVHRFGTGELHEDWRDKFKATNASTKFGEVGTALSATTQQGITTSLESRSLGVPLRHNIRMQQSASGTHFVAFPPQAITPPNPAVPAFSQPFPTMNRIQKRIRSLRDQVRNDLRVVRPFETGFLTVSQRNATALFGA